mmetsp:Transcript_6346/g.9623  ORF Transcript_6346/g.9623 Transcript_6346/m.9623 type:complete len:137 (-) Transcript_6346:149-559(-)
MMASYRSVAKLSQQFKLKACRNMTTQITHALPTDTARMLSPKGSRAALKLHDIFEEYRMQNYTQEYPSRFRKEIIRAADQNNDGYVSTEEIESVLKNIGASGRLTREDIDTIFKEAGEKRSESITAIPIERMISLI